MQISQFLLIRRRSPAAFRPLRIQRMHEQKVQHFQTICPCHPLPMHHRHQIDRFYVLVCPSRGMLVVCNVVVKFLPLQAMVSDASLRLLTRRRLLDGMVKQLALPTCWRRIQHSICFARSHCVRDSPVLFNSSRHVLGGASALAGKRHGLQGISSARLPGQRWQGVMCAVLHCPQ